MKNFLFSLATFLMQPIVRLLFRTKCVGAENVPEDGGVILVSNHINALDPFFIAVFMKRQFCCLAKKELFKNKLFGKIISSMGIIPVDRTSVGRERIDSALNVLSEEKVLCFFPQGTRYPGKDPRETVPKSGVGLFAYHSKCPVVPVNISTKNMRIKPFQKTTVTFGKPIKYEELGFEKGSINEYRSVAAYVFDKICLLGESKEDKK